MMAPLPVVPALPVYRTDEIRRIEASAIAHPQPPHLMERAGVAAAELARELIAGKSGSVLVLAGPGNNGGDGFVLARQLKQWWHRVSVVFTGERAKLSKDAAEAFDAWQTAGGETLTSFANDRMRGPGLIVDGLFGIGLERDLNGQYADLVTAINSSGTPVLALDIPSGLHADSGRVLGCAVRAQHTVTFIGLKPGLITLDGPDHCGELHLRTLGLDLEAVLPPSGRVIGSDVLASVLPRRALNSHKGTYGNVGVLGGAAGMTGAAVLAGRAALKLGAGRVYLGFLDPNAPSLDAGQPEMMFRPAEDVLTMDSLTCLVLGPGLSQSPGARRCVEQALGLNAALVIDADALNLIASDEALQAVCRARRTPTIMTPHPAEGARLSGQSVRSVQNDRVGAALALARRYQAITVLKGVGTVVGMPDGSFDINTSGNPGLASAGMGDVLSGIVGALLAQGADPVLATCAGVHLHGVAADRLYGRISGPIGLTASELVETAREILNQSIYSA